MRHKFLFASAMALALASAGIASAATFAFAVQYEGAGTASQVSGFDDMLATTMNAGDEFTYSLFAETGNAWTIEDNSFLFPFLALAVAESGTRNVNFTVNLFSDGVNVFNFAQSNVANSFGHLGSNIVAPPVGLSFDEWVLATESITTDASSTAIAILPFNGDGPEFYFDGTISYGAEVGAVPEPSTWALMIGGFGLVGATLRRRKSAIAA